LRYTSTPLWAIMTCSWVNFTFLIIIIKASLQAYPFCRLILFRGWQELTNLAIILNCSIVTFDGYVFVCFCVSILFRNLIKYWRRNILKQEHKLTFFKSLEFASHWNVKLRTLLYVNQRLGWYIFFDLNLPNTLWYKLLKTWLYQVYLPVSLPIPGIALAT
jgi:hypothetical protein